MLTKRDLLRSAAMAAITVTTAKSAPASAQNKAEWPSLVEAKAIAEEGFIYGLPLVMNYAVMNEFAVDTKSSQFKAPFNEINNQHRVATPEDTAVITPNSDTPYSMLWSDLRAEPMVVSVPAVDKKRYYSVQLIDGNTYNFGYIGSRATGTDAGRLHGGRPRLERRNARRDQEGLLVDDAVRARSFPHAALQSRRYCRTWRRCRPDTRRSRCPRSSSNPRHRAAPKIDFVPATTDGNQEELLRVSRRCPAVRSAVAGGQGRPRQARQHRHRSRQDVRLQGPVAEHKAAILLALKEGDDKVDKFLASGIKNINGWSVGAVLWRPSLFPTAIG